MITYESVLDRECYNCGSYNFTITIDGSPRIYQKIDCNDCGTCLECHDLRLKEEQTIDYYKDNIKFILNDLMLNYPNIQVSLLLNSSHFYQGNIVALGTELVKICINNVPNHFHYIRIDSIISIGYAEKEKEEENEEGKTKNKKKNSKDADKKEEK